MKTYILYQNGKLTVKEKGDNKKKYPILKRNLHNRHNLHNLHHSHHLYNSHFNHNIYYRKRCAHIKRLHL